MSLADSSPPLPPLPSAVLMPPNGLRIIPEGSNIGAQERSGEMKNIGQPESPWLIIARAIAKVATQAAPKVSGVLATSAGAPPIVGTLVTSGLTTLVVQSKSSVEGELLRSIKADTDALVQAPFNNGVNDLEDAKRATDPEERQKLIEDAIDKFKDARANMQGLKAKGLFGKAIAENQIGCCWTLLFNLDEASVWFVRAHSSATDYLLVKGSPVRAEWDNYMKHSGEPLWRKLNTLNTPRKILAAARTSFGPYGPFMMDFMESWEAMSKAGTKAAPVLGFINALQQLQWRAAPVFDLRFKEPSLTPSTWEEQLRSNRRRG
jgi:hypothetical protein